MLQGRVAKKTLEAAFGYLRELLVMDMVLIITKELILLLVKDIGLECHLEAMCRLGRSLYLGGFALVDGTSKVELVALSSLVAAEA